MNLCTIHLYSSSLEFKRVTIFPDNMLTHWPNVGPPSSVTLAQRWQMTLAQRNFVIGPTLLPTVGPTLGQCCTFYFTTLAQHWANVIFYFTTVGQYWANVSNYLKQHSRYLLWTWKYFGISLMQIS